MDFQRRFYEMDDSKDDLKDVFPHVANYPLTTKVDEMHVRLLWVIDQEFKKSPSYLEKDLLALASLEIFREISFFALTFEGCRSHHLNINSSDHLTREVFEGLFEQEYAFPRERLSELLGGQNVFRKHLKKTLGGSILKVRKHANLGHVYRGNANKLALQVKTNNFGSVLPILHHIIERRTSVNIRRDIADFIKYLSEILVTEVETTLGELPYELRQYIEDLIIRRCQETWEDMNFPFHKYINNQNGLFLSGTSGNYYDRLISYAFYRHDLKVIRFGHGADRGLFDDFSWEVIDLAFADVYVAHGEGESEVLSGRTSRLQLPSISNSSVKFIDFGSDYHRSISDIFSVDTGGQVNKNYRKNVVIGAPAFSGTARAMPFIKPHDFVCFDLQIKTLNMVNRLGYNPLIKRHPKGKLAGRAIYSHYGANEIFGQNFVQCTTMADAYVFSVAGSAFVEALCTMKPVVLLNIPYRPFNKDIFSNMEQCCEIIDVDVDHSGHLDIDASRLRDAIESDVDVNKRFQFLERYLFNGRFDVADFMELF